MANKNQKLIIGGGVALLGLGFLFFGRSANAAENGGFVQSAPGGSSGQNTFTKALAGLLNNPVDQSVVDTIPGDDNANAFVKPPPSIGPGPKLSPPSPPPVAYAPPVVRQLPRISGGGGGFSRSGASTQLR